MELEQNLVTNLHPLLDRREIVWFIVLNIGLKNKNSQLRYPSKLFYDLNTHLVLL